MCKRLSTTIKGKQVVGMQEVALNLMTHTQSMKMVMEELFQSRQQEEPVEVESDDSESKSYQGSGETAVAAFDPNKEETQVWLKRIDLYEFACLPWDAWTENEFTKQQWNMIKEGEGVITGDVRLTLKLVYKVFKFSYLSVLAMGRKVIDSQMKGKFGSPIGAKSYYKKTAYMSKEDFAPLYQVERGDKVTPTALGLKTLAADTLMEEGVVSGSKRQKLLLGSPTIDVKSPFKVSWKDLEEHNTKVNFFSMGSEFKKSESKGKKITLFPTGIVGSTGKNVSESLLVKEGSSASHGAMGIFSMEEATNCLTDLSMRRSRIRKRCRRRLQALQLKWVDGLKTALDEQFKELDKKMAAMTTENVLLINRLSPLAEMKKESVKRENEALKIENERLVAEMKEMRNNCKEIEDSLSKLKAELSSELLEPDRNLAAEAESNVEKQADAGFVGEKVVELDAKGDIGEQTT
ncbi:hypothetical protein L7F22_053439 [Adiantum nelumboides]|nr:hypothetical protein [Adiantum nelumboides]